MFDGLKLEPSMGGFGALLDMPKEEKSLIDFKLQDIEQDDYFPADDQNDFEQQVPEPM